MPLDGAPEGLAVGDRTSLSNGMQVTIVEIGDGIAVVDGNHPLAGEALTFEIEVVEVTPGQ